MKNKTTAPPFSFYHYKGFVTSVYDGDSITCDLDLGLNVWLKNQKIRLHGIDTPEIRGEEREMGLISKARVEELILNKEVVIFTHKTGKYGRWLGTVWFFHEFEGESNWININALLLSEGHAEVYDK